MQLVVAVDKKSRKSFMNDMTFVINSFSFQSIFVSVDFLAVFCCGVFASQFPVEIFSQEYLFLLCQDKMRIVQHLKRQKP